MKQAFLILLLSACAFAQTSNPCATSTNVKTVSIAISTVTTTQLVAAPIATQAVWICGIMFTAVTGTGATYQLEYGTQTTTPCDTGATVLTGAMIGNGGPVAYGATIPVPLAKQVCMVTGGTGPNAQGIMTYIVANQ